MPAEAAFDVYGAVVQRNIRDNRLRFVVRLFDEPDFQDMQTYCDVVCGVYCSVAVHVGVFHVAVVKNL